MNRNVHGTALSTRKAIQEPHRCPYSYVSTNYVKAIKGGAIPGRGTVYT